MTKVRLSLAANQAIGELTSLSREIQHYKAHTSLLSDPKELKTFVGLLAKKNALKTALLEFNYRQVAFRNRTVTLSHLLENKSQLELAIKSLQSVLDTFSKQQREAYHQQSILLAEINSLLQKENMTLLTIVYEDTLITNL